MKGEYFKILIYYFISIVFLYQMITLTFLHCIVIFFNQMRFIILHHFVFLLFIRPVYQASLSDQLIKPVYQTSLSDQFIRPVYHASLSDQFVRPFYQASLSDHFIRPVYQTSLWNQLIRPLYQTSWSDYFIRPVCQTSLLDQLVRPFYQDSSSDQFIRPFYQTSLYWRMGYTPAGRLGIASLRRTHRADTMTASQSFTGQSYTLRWRRCNSSDRTSLGSKWRRRRGDGTLWDVTSPLKKPWW